MNKRRTDKRRKETQERKTRMRNKKKIDWEGEREGPGIKEGRGAGKKEDKKLIGGHKK